jgi:hypothetical protein
VRFTQHTGQTQFPSASRERHTVSTKLERGTPSLIADNAPIYGPNGRHGRRAPGVEEALDPRLAQSSLSPLIALPLESFDRSLEPGLPASAIGFPSPQLAPYVQPPPGRAADLLATTDRFGATGPESSPAPGGGAVSRGNNSMAASWGATIPGSPKANLAPPPEGIYRTFEDLLSNVQRIARNEGYGVVKLRASNYREGKPTRYDLVCDRGGVKYASTAKKRNPSTRKVDCPWRAKAVCEVNLGNQWRFQVQEARHNHEARVQVTPTGQENTSAAQTFRSLSNKLDRMNHEISQGFNTIVQRLENMEKRMESLEQGGRGMLANGPPLHPALGTPGLPAGLSNGGMTNGGLGGLGTVDGHRLNSVEARLSQLEQQQRGMDLPMDDVDSRLLAQSVI